MASQLYVNAKVFTGTGPDHFASAFGITDGVFDWVGESADVLGEQALDLEGATVLPGLLDVHTHPAMLATLADSIPVFPPRVTSLRELLDRLREHPNRGKDDGSWIEAFGYDDAKYPDGRPTRQTLDTISMTQAVFARRSDGHTATVNSKALELAGITHDTPDPPGARYERDDHGELTGVLTELAAVEAVHAARPAKTSHEEVGDIVALSDRFLSHGIVAVNDMFADLVPDPLQRFRAAAERGFRPQVVMFLSWYPDMPDLPEDEKKGQVTVGGVKLFLDGVYSNRTAWVENPYPGTVDDHGVRTLGDEDLLAAVEWARRNRVQVAIHVMGDRSMSHVLDLFEGEQPWLGGLPSIRLEHATLVRPEMVDRLARARMRFGVVTHSIFFFAEYDSYARNLAPEQVPIAYPIRALYERTPLLAMASDTPATAWEDADDVFTSVQAAVDRRAYDGSDMNQAEKITVGQALHLYTGKAAEMSALTGVGLIAPGYEGNFVVLDRDVFSAEPSEIAKTEVQRTIVRGEVTLERE